ncbi:hypothetical protein D3C78_1353090 [compost metagenome]
MGSETARIAGLLHEGAVDAPVGMLRVQTRDQLGIPTGMHQAEAPGIKEQRQFVHPVEKVVPVPRVILELREGLADQPLIARIVLAGKLATTPRQSRRGPAE